MVELECGTAKNCALLTGNLEVAGERKVGAGMRITAGRGVVQHRRPARLAGAPEAAFAQRTLDGARPLNRQRDI